MIPNILHHIWIGDKPTPYHWMNTWKLLHPDWQYYLWDNFSFSSYQFKNKRLIDSFIEFGKYNGAADLMRYEILCEFGGVMPGSDCECIHPITDLINCSAFTVYENEKIYPKYTSPILGSVAGHSFLKFLIEYFYDNTESIMDKLPTHYSYQLTGNYIIGKFIDEMKPDVTIYPSNVLIGKHHTGENGYYSETYRKQYAIQHWGTGKNLY